MRSEVEGSVLRIRVATAALVLATFAFRAWFTTTLSLSGDEAYHWEWSRHLALGYHDHPGMISWLIHLSTSVFGSGSEFAVRVPALVCMAGVWFVVRAFTKEIVTRRGGSPLQAERAGCLALVFVMFAPVTAVLSMYVSTDPPLLFGWALFLWLGYRLFEDGRVVDGIGAGFALGFALESKLLALLLAPAALAYVVLAARRGLRLRPRAFVAAFGVTALMLGPLLLWNVQHDWWTFRFNFVARQGEKDASWMHPLGYLAGQLALLSPALFVLIVSGLVHAWRDGRRGHRSSLYLFAFCVVPLAAFLAISMRRDVGAHWPTMAWLAGIVLVASALSLGGGFVRPRLERWSVRIAVAMTIGLHVLAHVPQRFLDFDLEWFGKPETVRIKAFAERYGWEELGVEVARRREALARETGAPVFVAATQYGVAASVAFYVPGHTDVHLWSPPRAHGDNYHYWNDFAALAGQGAVVVFKRDVQDHLPLLRAHFAEVDAPFELRIHDGQRWIRSFHVVTCRGFDGRDPFPRLQEGD